MQKLNRATATLAGLLSVAAVATPGVVGATGQWSNDNYGGNDWSNNNWQDHNKWDWRSKYCNWGDNYKNNWNWGNWNNMKDRCNHDQDNHRDCDHNKDHNKNW